MRWYFQKRLKQWISKDCTHEEELVCATTWNSWEKHVEEVTGLIKLWIQHTPLKSISLKVVNVMLRYLSENQANPQKASA